jgi:hypothetical protein
MSLENVNHFLNPSLAGEHNSWSLPDLNTMAHRRLPDLLTEKNDAIVRADIHSLWIKWFVEGICNPLNYVDDLTKGHAHVLFDVTERVETLFIHETKGRKDLFAKQITERVMVEVTRQRMLKRDYATPKTKADLVAAATVPRCWMCGYAFSAEALDIFLKKPGAGVPQLPKLLDVLRPRGIIVRDISIEVEHVMPVAAGGKGTSNLALACGWCNKYKGAKTSIYDASFRAPRVPFKLGKHIFYELPHPFWTIRLLAVRRGCEHIGGCSAHANTDEMFIAPVSTLGSPNPSNLQVFCGAHDPYRLDRFVPHATAEKIWKDRTR